MQPADRPQASPAERRREPRALCSNVAEVSFLDQAGTEVRQHALVEDVSGAGACLSSSLPVPVGGRLALRAEGFSAEGRVEYCRLGDYSFLIGLSFAPDEGPGEQGWRPDHLLSLGEDEEPAD